MSGIVGSRLNNRGSGVVGSLGTDGQVLTSSGAGVGATYEAAASGGYTATHLHYETPEGLAYKNMDVAGNMNVDSFDISERGVYLIIVEWRFGWRNMGNFFNVWLGTSSAGGQIGNKRMFAENMTGTSGNANVVLNTMWQVSFGTSLSYPYTTYINAYNSNANATALFNATDSNGYPAIFQIKLRDTTTATGVVAVGT
jgi:hypothetical protein